MPNAALSIFALCLLGSCRTTDRELAPLVGDDMLERLAYVSQLDELPDTVADYARCSAAATLNAFLLLGGDFASLASQLGVATDLTFENVHRFARRVAARWCG